MTANLTLLILAGLLFATGIYLLLERSLTRVLLGLMLLTNGANVLLLASGGSAGLAPFFSKGTDPAEYNDPLPQALILTSIVISFAVTAFMLALIYRTWQLGRLDVVPDDIEDRRVAAQSSWDAEDDADVPEDLSEFVSPEEAAAADQVALATPDPRRHGDGAEPAQVHSAMRKEGERE